jgi:hypothetical protein
VKFAVVIGCIVCSVIIAFVLLVFAVDRFILSPAPPAAPVHGK